MTTDSEIRLTRLAKRTGCAAKHPPGFLLHFRRSIFENRRGCRSAFFKHLQSALGKIIAQ